MIQKIKGKCKYCGKEYTRSYMGRHLLACKERQSRLMAENGSRQCGYFVLKIYPRYVFRYDYWLFIEVREDATLRDVDSFLRDIWLECCGHLSAFNIGGTSYEVMPDEDSFWGEPAKSMNYKLKTVLSKGMTIGYEYDFGSTTELILSVIDYRVGGRRKEKLTILSRNNPHEMICDECGKKPAVMICPMCMWEGEGLLCEDCSETHSCGEDMLLDVCNSPRMGVCGYVGSDIYPDQFVPDTEKED